MREKDTQVHALRDQIQAQAENMAKLQGEISKMIVQSRFSPRNNEESKYFKKDMSGYQPAAKKNINQ